MILSEREAIMDDAINKVQPGSTVTAVVRNLVPYGAFISIKDPETGDLSGGHVSSVKIHHGIYGYPAGQSGAGAPVCSMKDSKCSLQYEKLAA